MKFYNKFHGNTNYRLILITIPLFELKPQWIRTFGATRFVIKGNFRRF